MYRGETTLMYIPTPAPSGDSTSFPLTPMRVRSFQIQQVHPVEADWAVETPLADLREIHDLTCRR